MEARSWHRHYDFFVPRSIRYPEIPVADLLQFAASTNPDKTALNFYGTKTTFAQLRQQVLKMASALANLGIGKGDRIGLHMPNCPQYIISYYAGLSLGAIIVNINPLYTANELKEIARQTNLSLLFTFDLALKQVRELCRDIAISHVIVTRISDFIDGLPVSTPEEICGSDPGWGHFSVILEGSSDIKLPRIEIGPQDPALIQFTGGTTGIPKGAVLTHANIIASVVANTMWGDYILQAKDPDIRNVLVVLPYFHLFGNILCLNWGIYTCSTQIILPRFDIEEVMTTLAGAKGIGFFPAVPTMINAIINHPKAADLNLGKKLTQISSAAAPMPQEMIYKLKEMGVFYSEGWGMTETTSMGTSLPLMGRKKVGSIGIPAPDTDIRLVDVEDGVTIVPRGTPGEILIKGPTVMKEYWNNPEETANHLKDGWLHTG
ncbi:MAG: Long-chain-fatty-acid CoA ligase (AMP-forming), partial [Firmicutes bacterium]|nr:Long-chain-fatty-acid CoA ligase (AMP-forming) [Bacillota bacterium]